MALTILKGIKRLRIFVGETCHYHRQPLYHAILVAARKHGLAGATVIRAIEGYGSSSLIQSSGLWIWPPDLPVVIEIIDRQERIEEFLPLLDSMVSSGLVTVDDVAVTHFQSRSDQNRKTREIP